MARKRTSLKKERKTNKTGQEVYHNNQQLITKLFEDNRQSL